MSVVEENEIVARLLEERGFEEPAPWVCSTPITATSPEPPSEWANDQQRHLDDWRRHYKIRAALLAEYRRDNPT